MVKFSPAAMFTILEKSFSSFFAGVWEDALSAGAAGFSIVVFGSFSTDLPKNNSEVAKKHSVQWMQQ